MSQTIFNIIFVSLTGLTIILIGVMIKEANIQKNCNHTWTSAGRRSEDFSEAVCFKCGKQSTVTVEQLSKRVSTVNKCPRVIA